MATVAVARGVGREVAAMEVAKVAAVRAVVVRVRAVEATESVPV